MYFHNHTTEEEEEESDEDMGFDLFGDVAYESAPYRMDFRMVDRKKGKKVSPMKTKKEEG